MSMRSAFAGAIFVASLSVWVAGCETNGSSGPAVRATGEQRQSAVDSLTHHVAR
jgi:hypothetical protein